MFYNLLAEQGSGGTIVIFGVMLVLIIGLFIWQSISGKKKQKEAQNMVDSLKKGDRVKTIGGICGFVVEINNNENTFVLETGTDDKKSYVKFDKGAIYQTAPAEGSAVAEKNEKPAPSEEVSEESVSSSEAETQPAPKKKAKKEREETL